MYDPLCDIIENVDEERCSKVLSYPIVKTSDDYNEGEERRV